MSDNIIMEPEINRVKSDEFYVFYEMMIQSLKTDNVKDGLNNSFRLLRTFLKCGNISLYRKKDNGPYIYNVSDSEKNELAKSISCIVNKTYPLAEQRGVFYLNLNLSDRLKNLMLIHVKIDDFDCIVSIVNNRNIDNLEPQFWTRLRDTLFIIMKRTSSFERNTSAISMDLLTGLDNRNSYEQRIATIDESDPKLLVGIFDLFRLKYINDNYTHVKGDLYIKEAAKILAKYWPKKKCYISDDYKETYDSTGHCVYRYGGDEFVLFTNVESLDLANIKAGLAQDEVRMIDLGIKDDVKLGINYGIVSHNPGDSIKTSIMRADDIMQEHKTLTYKKYNLERRK